jgi:hypothetical protein
MLSLVVECSILVEFVVCGGFVQKLVVYGEKVITPKNIKYIYIYIYGNLINFTYIIKQF